MHVLRLGSDEFVLLQCCCYLLLFVCFVNCFVACIDVVSRGVMIGMSGESWRHKSTLSPIPSSQDWACWSSSLLLCLIYLFIF